MRFHAQTLMPSTGDLDDVLSCTVTNELPCTSPDGMSCTVMRFCTHVLLLSAGDMDDVVSCTKVDE